MSAASNRLRREGPSVHHVLCDKRWDPLRCTCLVPRVAAALADLLDAIPNPLKLGLTVREQRRIVAARAALEAAITRGAS